MPKKYVFSTNGCWIPLAPTDLGIATILDAVKPSGSGPVLQQIELDENAAKLQGQEFQLVLAEMEYDMKTFKVWQKKVQDYEIRLISLKDDWLMKRHSAAKSAMELFLDTKASESQNLPQSPRTSVGVNFTLKLE